MSSKKKTKKQRTEQLSDLTIFRRALFAKQTIRQSLGVIRPKLTPDSLSELLPTLLTNSTYRTGLVRNPFPREFEGIKPGRPYAPISPEYDFTWTSIVLEHYSEELTRFVAARDSFYRALLSADFKGAADGLDSIQGDFGLSLWIIGARIALLQARDGVTQQKQYLEEVLNRSSLNVAVATIAFYLSIAAEEHVSKAELDREMEEITSASPYPDFIEYFRYHANPLDLPARPYVTVAQEENAPIIDRFETFTEMALLEVVNSSSLGDLGHIHLAAKRLLPTGDIRIKNLCFLFEPGIGELFQDREFISACDLYTCGNYDEVKTQALRAVTLMPERSWWYDLLVRSISNSGSSETNPVGPAGSFVNQVITELLKLRSFEGDLDEANYRLQKLALIGRMPASRYLASVDSASVPMIVREHVSKNEALWILSSPLNNSLHLRYVKALSPEAAAILAREDGITMQLASTALSGIDPPTNPKIPLMRQKQFLGHAALNRKDPITALENYRSYQSVAGSAEALRALNLLFSAQKAANRYDDAIKTFADAYLDQPAAARLIPLPDLAEWVVENQGVDALALDASIVLHAYSTLFGSEYDGDLSDAYENVLDLHRVDRPSALLNKDIPRNRLVHFIRHVCTVSRMEDGTGFERIDEIEQERVLLLQWLNAVDGSNGPRYIAEIKAITKDQEVAFTSAHLERSKIYVNEEVVRRSFDAEMRYSFARYREMLVEPNLETRAEAIEQRIKKLLRDAEDELRNIKLPSTERESLFRSIYNIALSSFLIYPNGGLKTYLSTRILHGAFEGEMRSPLARSHLLFSRERLAASREFDLAWSDRLSHLAPANYTAARDAVLKFSTRFTEMLLDLLNHRVRIRLNITPQGLLDYELSEQQHQLIRTRLSTSDDYDEFIDALFDEFWAQTDQGLERIKREIGGVFASHVHAALDALISSVAQLGGDVGDLVNTIVQARTEFANSVERVSAWFTRSGLLPASPFTLDVAIEVAIRITNNCFPSCEIQPSVDGETAIRLPGPWLNPIVDLLCNCFQNAVEHSGNGMPPKLTLCVSDRGQDLHLDILNFLDPAIDVSQRSIRIATMLEATRHGDQRHATEERGSGFSKMSRIMKFDLPVGGSFDVVVDQTSRCVTVSFTIPKVENE